MMEATVVLNIIEALVQGMVGLLSGFKTFLLSIENHENREQSLPIFITSFGGSLPNQTRAKFYKGWRRSNFVNIEVAPEQYNQNSKRKNNDNHPGPVICQQCSHISTFPCFDWCIF
jgi:hypothetical protein